MSLRKRAWENGRFWQKNLSREEEKYFTGVASKMDEKYDSKPLDSKARGKSFTPQ